MARKKLFTIKLARNKSFIIIIMKLKRNHYFISFLRVCRYHRKARNLLFHIITPNFNIYRITFIILITLFTFFINLLVGFIIDFLIIYFLPHTIPHEFVTFVTTSLTGMFCLSRVINKLQRFNIVGLTLIKIINFKILPLNWPLKSSYH